MEKLKDVFQFTQELMLPTYGNAHADIRVQWFHTAAIQAIGEIKLLNNVTFSKTIGDASLLIVSSIIDVIQWSNKFSDKLLGFDKEYSMAIYENELDLPVDENLKEQQISDFQLEARRLVHVEKLHMQTLMTLFRLLSVRHLKWKRHFQK